MTSEGRGAGLAGLAGIEREVAMRAQVLSKAVGQWCAVWDAAAVVGLAETRYGREWQASLGRFLLLADDQRLAWLGRPWRWRMEHVHCDTAPVPGRVTRPERARDMVLSAVRGWLAACVRTVPDAGAVVTTQQAVSSLETWTLAHGVQLPGQQKMHRAVLGEALIAAGVLWDPEARIWRGIRLNGENGNGE